MVIASRAWWLGLALLCSAGETHAETMAPDRLALERGCMSCHGVTRRQVGPSFAQIAARYQSEARAAEHLAVRIKQGSVGNWGRVIMPRQSKVGDAEARQLADWVLATPPPAR